MGCSSSVSGETLHLPNLHPGELEGGGINRCCFQGRARANWLTWPGAFCGAETFPGREGLLPAAVRSGTQYVDSVSRNKECCPSAPV